MRYLLYGKPSFIVSAEKDSHILWSLPNGLLLQTKYSRVHICGEQITDVTHGGAETEWNFLWNGITEEKT